MENPRCKNGDFEALTGHQLYVLTAEYNADCEVLDVVCPTFESWVAAKLHDLRVQTGVTV